MKHSPFRQRLTIRHLLALFPVGLLFALALEKVGDTDLFWHLKAGQWMLAHRAIPRVGLWSWAGEALPWTTHEWLFEVCAAALFSLAGWAGLIVAKAALVAGAFALVLDHARRRSGSVGLAAFLALGAGILTIPFWAERPQLVTYAFAAYLLRALWQWERGERRHLWVVPPLVLVWANFHGAYFLAFLLLALYAAGEALAQVWARRRGEPARWERVRHPAAVMGASALLALLNPHGTGILLYPLSYIGFTSLTGFVVEWLPPNFQQWPMRLFALFVLAALAALIASPRRPRATDLLLVLLLVGMALLAVRNVPLAIIGLTPILAEHLRALWDHAVPNRPAADPEPPTAPMAAANWVLLFLLLVICLARLPLGGRPADLVKTKGQPVEAVAWLKAHPLPGRMCNFYDWGGYLIWELSPRYSVFVDGRTDVYGQELMGRYLKLWRLAPGWQKVLDDYRVDWVLWRIGAPLTQVLELSPRWREVYRDKTAVIFVRRQALGEARAAVTEGIAER